MSNFWTRTITGLSMVFILLTTLALNYWAFALILFALTICGLWEFYTLFSTDYCAPQRWFGIVAGGLLFIALTIYPFFSFSPLFLIPLIFFPFMIEIFRKRLYPMTNIAVTLTGIGYIAVPFGLLNLMNGEEVTRLIGFPVLLTGALILTWFYDTGAYLFGRQFGKHLFFERLSPKKTWEGLFAGVIIALLTAFGFSFFAPEIIVTDWLLIALIVTLFGTIGDLAESMFKRGLHVKDSGSILPGHGGILDRFDSLFISVPFVFLYLVFRNLI